MGRKHTENDLAPDEQLGAPDEADAQLANRRNRHAQGRNKSKSDDGDNDLSGDESAALDLIEATQGMRGDPHGLDWCSAQIASVDKIRKKHPSDTRVREARNNLVMQQNQCALEQQAVLGRIINAIDTIKADDPNASDKLSAENAKADPWMHGAAGETAIARDVRTATENKQHAIGEAHKKAEKPAASPAPLAPPPPPPKAAEPSPPAAAKPEPPAAAKPEPPAANPAATPEAAKPHEEAPKDPDADAKVQAIEAALPAMIDTPQAMTWLEEVEPRTTLLLSRATDQKKASDVRAKLVAAQPIIFAKQQEAFAKFTSELRGVKADSPGAAEKIDKIWHRVEPWLGGKTQGESLKVIRDQKLREISQASEKREEGQAHGGEHESPEHKTAEQKMRLFAVGRGAVALKELQGAKFEVGSTCASLALMGFKTLALTLSNPALLAAGPIMGLVAAWQSDERRAEIARMQELLENLSTIEDPAAIAFLEEQFVKLNKDFGVLEIMVADQLAKTKPSESKGPAPNPGLSMARIELLSTISDITGGRKDKQISALVAKLNNAESIRTAREMVVHADDDDAILTILGDSVKKQGTERAMDGVEGGLELAEHEHESLEMLKHEKPGGEHGLEHGAGIALTELVLVAKGVKLLHIKRELPEIRAGVKEGEAASQEMDAEARKHHWKT
jgi:hypothetical protein